MTSPRLLIPLLMAAAMAVGQTPSPPASAQGSNPQAVSQSAQQQAPPQSSNANARGKRPPSAKTKKEYDQYLAVANAPDAATSEKLAREFEVQFPESELLSAVFQQVMGKYQKADNGDKTLDMGRKVLHYDPDNCVALMMNAMVLTERTQESDIDRDERLNEAKADAQRALDNISSGNFPVPPGFTPEQVQEFKDQINGMAYTALGTAELLRKNDSAAEQNLRKATEGPVGKGDPIVWYRLALALDHQKKYSEANGAITIAVAVAPAGSAVANMAKNEQSRLRQLAAGGTASDSTPKDRPEPEPVQPK